VYFLAGDVFLFRAAAGILSFLEAVLLCGDFEGTLTTLTKLPHVRLLVVVLLLAWLRPLTCVHACGCVSVCLWMCFVCLCFLYMLSACVYAYLFSDCDYVSFRVLLLYVAFHSTGSFGCRPVDESYPTSSPE
jgi:hypothetical protein